MQLNINQQLAVQTINGPLRIIAGAGTGKTRTLIERIKHIIDNHGLNGQILAITFTNKAARELQERLVNENIKGVNALTFHSLAAKLLREFWDAEFKIIDEKEKKEILRGILNEEEWKKVEEVKKEMEEARHHGSTAPLCNVFSCVANKSCLRGDYGASNGEDMRTREGRNVLTEERLTEIIKQFEEVLTEKRALDFTGLIIKLLNIWEGKPEILRKCREKFRYVLIDEYQDVNQTQIELTRKLVEPHKNICAVGDPDQTIYSWRGASEKTMEDFLTIYPEAKTITLEENYRNPPLILRGAEKLIGFNTNRVEKRLKAVKTETREIDYWEARNEEEFYEIIFHLLEKCFGSHSAMHLADQLDTTNENNFYKFNELAFLYRTQTQGRKLAARLAQRGYPCQLSSGEDFWQSAEIEKFLEELNKLKELVFNHEEKIIFRDWLTKRMENFIENEKLSKIRANNLFKLIPFATAFNYLKINEALIAFLDEAKLNQEADNILAGDKINLLTFHAAKGLEFPIVFIIGLEEDLTPYKKFKDEQYPLNEERRLFYVGMTRATKNLHLFYTKKSFADKMNERSRFLSEIGLENMKLNKLPEKNFKKLQKKEAKRAQMKMF